MEIILDYREKKLIETCFSLIQTNENFNKIVLKNENLHIGDIIIKHNNEVKIIIERKTISDLVSSIKDKRYEEQSFRLDSLEHHNHNIIYLIEGSCEKQNKEKQMIYSSIFSLNYYKGFSVFRSANINETAYIICNMVLKINNKNKNSYYKNIYLQPETENVSQNQNQKENDILNVNDEDVNNEDVNNEEHLKDNKEYCGLIMKKKSSMITPDNISEIMLCQIPGISKITAIEILKRFDGKINKLITSLNNDPKCIDNLSYTVPNTNKLRKINKTSIDNIIKYLKI
jgi:ERCC4-type nuclease